MTTWSETSIDAPTNDNIGEEPWVVVRDLVKKADQGFYIQNGIHIGPGMPGWASVSGHDRSTLWGKGVPIVLGNSVEDKSRVGSWLTARAGSVRFPLPDKLQTTQVSFDFYCPGQSQAVSVFFNEKNLGTLNLKSGWHRYSLPVGDVSKGEHRLRFWFRKTYQRGRLRTPGALGHVTVGKDSLVGTKPDWTVDDLVSGLPAAADSEWTYYTVASRDMRLEGQFNVGARAARIEVYADTDDGERQILHAAKLKPTEKHPFSVDLPSRGESAYRIGLKVKGESGHQHAWHGVQLKARRAKTSQKAPKAQVIKRLVFVVLDGLTESNLRLNRSGLFAATPTLDRMSQEGLALTRVYTGGEGLSSRVSSILSWMFEHTNEKKERFRRALFSQSGLNLSNALRQELDREVIRPKAPIHMMLDEVHRWLQLGGRSPYALTIVLRGDPKPSENEGSTLTIDGANLKSEKGLAGRIVRGRQTTSIDQALAQIMGLLSYDNGLEDTLFVVMGYEKMVSGTVKTVKPDSFFSPLIFWIKGHGIDSGSVDHKPHTSAAQILKGIPSESALRELQVSFPQLGSWSDLHGAVSHENKNLTSISIGPWLLVLQDAKRYGLYHFKENWQSLGQGHPITQRAIRVLVQD